MNYYKNDGTLSDMHNCDYCQIELKGNHAQTNNACALISKSSIPLVSSFEWYCGKDGYPVAYKCIDDANIKLGRGTKLHKLLIDCPKGLVIDHINRNKLDNRIENLRICTPRENSYNRSKASNIKYKGVKKSGNMWIASVTKDGVKHEINNIATELEAAKMYDIMAEELFGNFAAKNFSV